MNRINVRKILFFQLLITATAITACHKNEFAPAPDATQSATTTSLVPLTAASLLADSPIVASTTYQVFINNNPIGVNKERCFDYDANGGQRTVHTALYNYLPGAQVKIICDSAFAAYTISPQRLGIAATHTGNELLFTLPTAYYNFAIIIPGKEPLFLFSAPNLFSYKPGAVVFDSGVHTTANGEFRLQSNTTYYLEEGAVLNGKVIIENASNVKIIGRGYIDDRRSPVTGNFLKIYNSDSIEIKGIGIRHAALGWQTDIVNSKHITMAFSNLLSFGQNNDGLDVGTGCQDVRFSHCFVGSGDDGFGWHATNAAAYGEAPLQGCNANDCMIWQSAGCGIRIGSSLETTEVKNLKFKNIDIAKTSKGIYAVAIPNSDWADVHDLIFEEIHDEEPTNNKFVLGYIQQNANSNPVYRPGYISDVQFLNCSSYATQAVFEGYDSTHRISNVTFTNVKVAGRNMLQSDVTANQFTDNIIVY
ncbi:MAG: glycosyl hydrolase family 28 protein [Niabella sp.]